MTQQFQKHILNQVISQKSLFNYLLEVSDFHAPALTRAPSLLSHARPSHTGTFTDCSQPGAANELEVESKVK